MEITLEQSIASAVGFVVDQDIEGTKAYFDEVPEKFYVPSVYFPITYIEAQKVTLRSFRNTITFDVWVMAGTDWDAEARAAAIRYAIMLNDMAIPILNKDGTPTGKHLKAQEPTQRRIDEGIVSVSIPVREYFRRDDTGMTTQNFYLSWKKATDKFREEEHDAD